VNDYRKCNFFETIGTQVAMLFYPKKQKKLNIEAQFKKKTGLSRFIKF
jgi:hypothetical protein